MIMAGMMYEKDDYKNWETNDEDSNANMCVWYYDRMPGDV
jgi:hypothetical protein